MESSRHINFAKHFALLYSTGKVVEVGKLEDIRQGGLVDRSEVATRPLGAVGLGLQVKS